MIYTIKNENLTVKISSLGAELQSVCYKGKEYLWQGNPEYWTGHAPILFPVVARNLNDEISVAGKSYPMPRHGLFRTREYIPTNQTESSCTFTFKSSEETKKSYPFDFEFTLTYSLEGNKLVHSFETKNTGDSTLYYCLGGHPAIALPDSTFGDWELQFEKSEPLNSLMVAPDLLIDGANTYPVVHKNGVLPLTRELFQYDTIIFEGLTSTTLTVRTKDKLCGATLDFKEFPTVAIWAKTVDGADYVCLEPWQGTGQRIGETTSLENRHDVLKVEPNETSKKTFSIELF